MISVTVLSVSEGELRRLEVLRDVERGGLPVSAAAQLLGRSERQVWRLLKAFRSDGVSGLISKKRGRPSNRKIVAAVRAAVLWIVRQNYADFGPTLAAEKLAGEHGFSFSSETLRKWMIADGLWLDRKQRQKRVHQPRPRRECLGELVQVDGSEHWWFEDRGPQCTLLVFVDDATSRLMHLQFVESESTFAYFQAARSYLEAWGKPVAFYSDKHGVFRVNHSGALGGRACPCEGRGHDPVRPGSARAQHRHHLRQFEPGQEPAPGVNRGPGRASEQDLTGSAGQGIAAGGRGHPGGKQRPAPGVHRRLQRALRQNAGEQQRPAPSLARRRRSRRCVCLEGGAHAFAGIDPAVRQD